MNKDALAIRHVPFEDLGTIGPSLQRQGYAIRYADAPLQDLQAIDPLGPDLVVVLGGPIGVYQQEAYPFIQTEVDLIARRLSAERPTLGICLGCQLMARALGARVYPGPRKEIGWGTVQLTDEGRSSCLQPLEQGGGVVLHWHGDTFDLPDGAVRLASNEICVNQAFRVGRHALALQFHIEVTAEALEAWLVGHACEIAATPNISVGGLRAGATAGAPTLAKTSEACIERWLAQTAAG